MDELVSIIIPVCNGSETIAECLNSILSQTYINLEILIIENNSTDNSYTICSEYASVDKRIKLYSFSGSGGAAKARNVGIEHSTGKYITFVDCDDWIEPCTIETLTCMMQKDIQLASTQVTKSNVSVSKEYSLNAKNYERMNRDTCLFAFIEGKITGYCYGKMYLSSLVKAIKFDESFKIGEDEKFVFDYILKIDNALHSQSFMYHYIQREGSICNSPYSKDRYSLVANGLYFESTLNSMSDIFKECVSINALKRSLSYIIMCKATGLDLSDKQGEETIRYYKKNCNIRVLRKMNVKKSWLIYGWILCRGYWFFNLFWSVTH